MNSWVLEKSASNYSAENIRLCSRRKLTKNQWIPWISYQQKEILISNLNRIVETTPNPISIFASRFFFTFFSACVADNQNEMVK